VSSGKHITRDGLHLRTSSGKLATGCVTCSQCPQARSTLLLALSGIDQTQCNHYPSSPARILGLGDINGVYTLTRRETDPCWWDLFLPCSGSYNYYNNCNDAPVSSIAITEIAIQYSNVYRIVRIYSTTGGQFLFYPASLLSSCSQTNTVSNLYSDWGGTITFDLW
jgi:hypothetical protein